MINARSRSITHNLANMSFDQIFDLTAGVYFNIICDLNLFKTLPPARPPPPFYSPLSLAQTPRLISKSARVINTSTHWISPHYISRAIHAAAATPPPAPNVPSFPTTHTIA